jgi:hypothetical protein
MNFILKRISLLAENGKRWQFALIAIFFFVAIFYVVSHSYYPGGEFIKLNPNQLRTINNIINDIPEDTANIREQREIRNKVIFAFLDRELEYKTDSSSGEPLKSLLSYTSNENVYNYLSETRILVKGPFWLTGYGIYQEAFLWSLIGVLISLIYHVSLANSKAPIEFIDADSGGFKTSEVSSHIAKMIYAPVATIVIVVGYSIISSTQQGLPDISVGKELLLFAFISGFYSGRVMRFLDKLKEILIPFGSLEPKAKDSLSVIAEFEVELPENSSIGKLNQEGLIFKTIHSYIEHSKTKNKTLLEKIENSKLVFKSPPLNPSQYSIYFEVEVQKENGDKILLKHSSELIIKSDLNSFKLQLNEK